jgi:hypothetical protein
VDVARRLTCEWCGDEFAAPEAPSGRWRKYCRPAHRQRAYEGRRVLREAHSELPRLREQRTSRADDPQLHTHLVIPNVLRGASRCCMPLASIHRSARLIAVVGGQVRGVEPGCASSTGLGPGLSRVVCSRPSAWVVRWGPVLVSLWEAVLPAEVLRLSAELARVDVLLDDPVVFEPFVPFFDPRVALCV